MEIYIGLVFLNVLDMVDALNYLVHADSMKNLLQLAQKKN